MSVKETEPGPNRFAYEGLGPVAGGTVTVTFTNAGKKPHELQFARVDAGHSQAELVATLKKLVGQGPAPTPSWLNPAGGVGVIPPGATQTATVILPVGQYYAVDTGAGPGNGPKPFERGAISAFSVSGGSPTGSLPATTAKIVAKDLPGDRHAFVVSGLKAGKNTITFKNLSKKQDHEITALPLLPGKTPADLKKALASNGPPTGPPPADFMHLSAAALLGPKTEQVTELNLAKPGQYVLVCFVMDRDGKGKPHFLKGMFKPVTIN